MAEIQVKENQWIVLTKDSLFWKAKIEPDGTKGQYVFDLCYGKNLAQAAKNEPSQSLQFESKDKCVAHYLKVMKDKLKNGYTIQVEQESKKKEKSKSKKHVESSANSKEFNIRNNKDVGFIQHHCNHIPLILTEDFDEMLEERHRHYSQKVPEEVTSSPKLGKRQKEQEIEEGSGKSNRRARSIKKPNELESTVKALNLPPALTISMILDQPRKETKTDYPIEPTSHKKTQKQPVFNTPNREMCQSISINDSSAAKTIETEKKSSTLKKQTNQTDQTSNDKGQAVQRSATSARSEKKVKLEKIEPQPASKQQVCISTTSDNPFPSTESLISAHSTSQSARISTMPAKCLCKRLISGPALLGSGASNIKPFTQKVQALLKDEYLLLSYRVEEDFTLHQQELHKFLSDQAATAAYEETLRYWKVIGYQQEDDESLDMLQQSTIDRLILRQQGFVDHSVVEAKTDHNANHSNAEEMNMEVIQTTEDVEHQAIHANNKLSKQSDSIQLSASKVKPVQEEQIFEPLNIGDNLHYDQYSHSNPDIRFSDVEQSSKSIEPVEASKRQATYQQYLDGTLLSRGRAAKMQPLGSMTTEMIPLMLLHNFKDTIEVTRRFSVTQIGFILRNLTESGAYGLAWNLSPGQAIK